MQASKYNSRAGRETSVIRVRRIEGRPISRFNIITKNREGAVKFLVISEAELILKDWQQVLKMPWQYTFDHTADIREVIYRRADEQELLKEAEEKERQEDEFF